MRPFVSDSEDNFLNFTDEKYDAFLRAADIAANREAQFSEYARAHNYLLERGLIIPLFNPVSVMLVRSEIGPVVPTMFDFQGAWTFD